MKFNNSHVDLDEIEEFTIAHYEDNAESFRVGTKDHDVSQNIDAFLSALPKEKYLDILDFGCGPGRDMCVFKSMGHRPVGLDGSKEFCKMAEQQSDCPTLNQQFLNLKLEEKSFDGILLMLLCFMCPVKNCQRF